MKRLLLAFAALLTFAQPAFAQAYQDPDWLDGTVPARDWSPSPTNPVGAAPADDYEPEDAADAGFDEEDWVYATDGTTGYVVGTDHERKARFLCEPGTDKTLDPIVFHGVPPPVGHEHQGSGNVGWDENSTYETLRADPSSTCMGGPLNAVIYWEPAMRKPLPSGVTVSIRPQSQIFYYVNGGQADPQRMTWLRNDIRFIGGANPLDYNDATRRAEYAAAELLYPGSSDTPAGFYGWECFAGSDLNTPVTVSRTASRWKEMHDMADPLKARHLKAEDGSDPWGGACTGSLGSPGRIIGNLLAPDCWDRHNLQGPGGRGHMAYSGTSGGGGRVEDCPNNWAHIPNLFSKSIYFHTGVADYGTWYLSSDRMNSPGTAADPTSLDPCRAAGPYFCPGSTLHFDYIFAWKASIAALWQRECLGITVRGVAPVDGPAACDPGQISKYLHLVEGGASPDPAMSGGCTTVLQCSNAVPGNNEQYAPIRTLGTDTLTIEHNH